MLLFEANIKYNTLRGKYRRRRNPLASKLSGSNWTITARFASLLVHVGVPHASAAMRRPGQIGLLAAAYNALRIPNESTSVSPMKESKIVRAAWSTTKMHSSPSFAKEMQFRRSDHGQKTRRILKMFHITTETQTIRSPWQRKDSTKCPQVPRRREQRCSPNTTRNDKNILNTHTRSLFPATTAGKHDRVAMT